MTFKKKFMVGAIFFVTRVYADDTVSLKTSSATTTHVTTPSKSDVISTAKIEALKAMLQAKQASTAPSKDSKQAPSKQPLKPVRTTAVKKEPVKALTPPVLSDEDLKRIAKEQDEKAEKLREISPLLQKPATSSPELSVRSASPSKPAPSTPKFQQPEKRQRLSSLSKRKNELKQNIKDSEQSLKFMHEAVIRQGSLVSTLIKDKSPSQKEANEQLTLMEKNLKMVQENYKKAQDELKKIETEEVSIKKELAAPAKDTLPDSSTTIPESRTLSTSPERLDKKDEEKEAAVPVASSGSEDTPPADSQLKPASPEKIGQEERGPKGKLSYFELLKMAATATALRVKSGITSGISAVYNWWSNKKENPEDTSAENLPSQE